VEADSASGFIAAVELGGYPVLITVAFSPSFLAGSAPCESKTFFGQWEKTYVRSGP
jgi:hypothetical protein